MPVAVKWLNVLPSEKAAQSPVAMLMWPASCVRREKCSGPWLTAKM